MERSIRPNVAPPKLRGLTGQPSFEPLQEMRGAKRIAEDPPIPGIDLHIVEHSKHGAAVTHDFTTENLGEARQGRELPEVAIALVAVVDRNRIGPQRAHG